MDNSIAENVGFPQLNRGEDQIEYLEALLSDLNEIEVAGPSHLYSAKMAVLLTLSQAYNRTGHRRAAIEAVKQLECLFFKVLDWADKPLDDKFTDLLIVSYCSLGYYGDARRVAIAIAEKAASKMSGSARQRRQAARWMIDQYVIAINEHYKKADRRASKIQALNIANESLSEKPSQVAVIKCVNSFSQVMGCGA